MCNENGNTVMLCRRPLTANAQWTSETSVKCFIQVSGVLRTGAGTGRTVELQQGAGNNA